MDGINLKQKNTGNQNSQNKKTTPVDNISTSSTQKPQPERGINQTANEGLSKNTKPTPIENVNTPPFPQIISKDQESKKGQNTIETKQKMEDIIPPVITTNSTKITGGKSKPNKKTVIATILGLFLLLGGIGAGLILTQQKQNIREKARIIQDCTTSQGCPGKRERTCGNSGQWRVWSECADIADDCPVTSMECTPEEIEIKDCTTSQGCPGKKGRHCTSSGQWSSWSGCNDIADDNCPVSSTTAPPSQCIDPTSPSARGAECQNTSGTFTGSCVIIYCPYDLGNDGKCNLNDRGAWQKFGSCVSLWNSLGANECGQIDTVNENHVYCNAKGVCESKIVDRPNCSDTPTKPAEPTASPTPSPTPGGEISVQCLNIQAFNTNWERINDLSILKSGDKVRFTVTGNASSGTISKARFTINGTQRAEVTAKRPGTNEFYDEYTIPEGVTTFNIDAQLYHSIIGWF